LKDFSYRLQLLKFASQISITRRWQSEKWPIENLYQPGVQKSLGVPSK